MIANAHVTSLRDQCCHGVTAWAICIAQSTQQQEQASRHHEGASKGKQGQARASNTATKCNQGAMSINFYAGC